MSEIFQFRNKSNNSSLINKLHLKSLDNFKQNNYLHSSCQKKNKEHFQQRNKHSKFKNQNKSKQSRHIQQFISCCSCSEILKIILDENNNLKQQNMFLQKQLNTQMQKQKQLSQTIMQYQSIMSILNAQNVRLHRQILFFSDDANYKVGKLKSSINKYIKNRSRITQHHSNMQEQKLLTEPSCHQQEQKYRRNSSLTGFINIESNIKHKNNSSCLNKQQKLFQSLLRQFKQQQNHGVKKQLRKRLIEMAENRNQ